MFPVINCLISALALVSSSPHLSKERLQRRHEESKLYLDAEVRLGVQPLLGVALARVDRHGRVRAGMRKGHGTGKSETTGKGKGKGTCRGEVSEGRTLWAD